MAPVLADHPFPLIPDLRADVKAGKEENLFDELTGTMTCVHNFLIRGLNAIYLQAPHVVPADHAAFARYAHQWYRCVCIHHDGEETNLFPGIEAVLGAPGKGVMQTSVDQHHAFHDGLEAFGAYANDCAAGRAAFDGARLVALVDAFGTILAQHLTDELATLESLRRFGLDGFQGARAVMKKEEEEQIKASGFLTGLPFVLLSVDDHFEDDRWNFPPVPRPVKYIIRSLGLTFHGWLKFAPVDSSGTMRHLYAVPKE